MLLGTEEFGGLLGEDLGVVEAYTKAETTRHEYNERLGDVHEH